MKKLLQSMISGIEKAGGTCDTIVVGSDVNAEKVREALIELGHDFHVIADDEISSKNIWVTSQEALGKMPCGGQN